MVKISKERLLSSDYFNILFENSNISVDAPTIDNVDGCFKKIKGFLLANDPKIIKQ